MSSFTPLNISGLQLWLDSKNYSSLTFDSSNNVTQWNDQSGYGRNGTNYCNTNLKVGYNTTAFNNLPAITFNSSGAGIACPMPAGTCSTGLTAFVMFKSAGNFTGNPGLVARDRDVNLLGSPFTMLFSTGGYIGNGINQTQFTSPLNVSTNTNLNLFLFTVNPVSYIQYLNGSLIYNFGVTYYGDTATQFYIGTRSGGYPTFSGAISEVIVYNSVLSTENRQIMEGYLAWKWNMVSSLPKNHPYYIHTPTTLIPDWNVYPYQSNAFVQTYIKDFVDISGNLVVRNANLNVLNGDISFNGSMYLQTSINTNSITTGNITATNNLLLTGTTGSTQINGNIFFGNTVSALNLVAGNLIGNSSTMNGNLYIANSLYVPNGNIYLSTAPYSLLYAQNTNNMNFGGINKPLLVNTTNGVTISGYLAGNSLISSTNPDKTLIGSNALQYHNTDYTAAFGYNTLNIYGNRSTNGGNYLTAIGTNAGSIMLDTSAVGIVQTGQYNTFIGANTGIDSSANSWSYSTAVGAGAIITANNQVTLGTSAGIIYSPNKTFIGTTTQNANYFSVTGNSFFTGDISANNYFVTTLSNTWTAGTTNNGDLTYIAATLGYGFSHCAEYIGAFSANNYFVIDCSFSTNTADASNVLYIPNNAILNSVYVQSKTNVSAATTINVTKNNISGGQISAIIPSGQNKGNNISSSITFSSGDFVNVNFGATGGGGSIYRVSMLFNYYTSPPTKPLNVTAGSTGATTASVNWSASFYSGSSPITGYTITSYPGNTVINVNGSTYSANFTGLTTGTIYYFSIFATSSVGNSAIVFTNNVIPSSFPLTSALKCCYSARLVVSTYTGPIFRLRNSSTGTTQDFYSDAAQSYLTTGANNTGTTYSSWIGANIAYVVTWYDQSPNAVHATNTTNNTTQPNISLQSSKYVLQFQKANSTSLTIPTSQIPNTVFCHFYNTNSGYGTILATSGVVLRFGGSGATNVNGDSNGGDWFFVSSGTKLSYNNGVATTTILLNGWNLLTLSVQTPSTAGFIKIGLDADPGRSINGYITEMMFHNTQAVSSDMLQYYNNRLF